LKLTVESQQKVDCAMIAEAKTAQKRVVEGRGRESRKYAFAEAKTCIADFAEARNDFQYRMSKT